MEKGVTRRKMPIRCGKKKVTLIWGLLECLFFSGLINGWFWMQQVLKSEEFFLDVCNTSLIPDLAEIFQKYNIHDMSSPPRSDTSGITYRRKCVYRRKDTNEIITSPPTTTEITFMTADALKLLKQNISGDIFCQEQDERLELLRSVVIIARNVLALPVGIFLDRYGTTKTRLVSVLCFVIGSLMMTFSSKDFPWLVIPAMTLLSVAGIAILLTNLQMSNLFGPRRYTAMSSYVGAFYTGSITLLCMEMTNYAGIINFQTSFMFITVGVVPILVSSIAFLPKSRVPWPLPADYLKNRYSGMEKDYNSKPSAWPRRISAGGKSRKDTPNIVPVIRSPIYIWSVMWCCILNLKTLASEANTPVHLRYLGADNETVTTYFKLYYQILLLALPFSPIFGILMDWRKRFVTDVRVEQMQNIQHALAVTVVLSVCSTITAMIPVLDLQAVTFIFLMTEKVAMLSAMFAFYTHIHFPNEVLGKLTGIALMSSGIFSSLHFPLREFIRDPLRGDPFYVNLIILLLLLVSMGHPVCVWYHCKLNLIGDSSSQDMEHMPVTLIIEEEPVRTGNKRVPSTNLDEKSGLQITDL